MVTAAIVRISDSVTSTEQIDPLIARVVQAFSTIDVSVIPTLYSRDDVRDIAQAVEVAGLNQVDVVITIGGTGISPLDYTARAMDPLLRFDIPGIPEAIRAYAYSHGDTSALLWRCRAGVLVAGPKRILVVNTADTDLGVEAALNTLIPLLPIALTTIHKNNNTRQL
ncbi:hypothetical protein EBF03_02405 [Arcanobacterium haemolyticum]|nr:hypothetical protein EBF03_02405 [Arcanobacterium haemolyticum]